MKIILILENGKEVIITSEYENLLEDVLKELIDAIPLKQVWFNSYADVSVKFSGYELTYINLEKVVGIIFEYDE